MNDLEEFMDEPGHLRLAEGMLMYSFTVRTSSFRILRRSAVDSPQCRFYPAKKPSILDVRLAGDAFVSQQRDDCLDVFVGNLRLSSLCGTPLDWMTLNNLLSDLRR